LTRPRIQLDIQHACDPALAPDRERLSRWAEAALTAAAAPRSELLIRLVEPDEIRRLNRDFRGRDCATNVLSFPFEPPPGLPTEIAGAPLGDLVICAAVVDREAGEQGKPPDAHWAHMVVHGVLHLLGYDHVSEPQADEMEHQERRILAELGYPDPYAELELSNGEP
jgi:probable rRNA maturation factor